MEWYNLTHEDRENLAIHAIYVYACSVKSASPDEDNIFGIYSGGGGTILLASINATTNELIVNR